MTRLRILLNRGDKDTVSFFVYGLARIVLTTPLRLLYGCEVRGAENLPRQGPAIIASSHSSNLDPCIVGISYPGVIRWMAKAELWRVPGLGWLVEKLGAFEVERGAADREAIRRARELLKQGWVVGMFPEGTRQRQGRLGEFLPGVGMLACGSEVPVIPLRIRGNEKIIRGFRLLRPKVVISVGEPVDLDLADMSRGRAFKEATSRIREAVDAL